MHRMISLQNVYYECGMFYQTPILLVSNMMYFTIQILEDSIYIFHYHPSLDYSYILNYHSNLNHSRAHILQLKHFHFSYLHWHFSVEISIWMLLQYTVVINLVSCYPLSFQMYWHCILPVSEINLWHYGKSWYVIFSCFRQIQKVTLVCCYKITQLMFLI
jgi:hypothetical protein